MKLFLNFPRQKILRSVISVLSSERSERVVKKSQETLPIMLIHSQIYVYIEGNLPEEERLNEEALLKWGG